MKIQSFTAAKELQDKISALKDKINKVEVMIDNHNTPIICVVELSGREGLGSYNCQDANAIRAMLRVDRDNMAIELSVLQSKFDSL